MLKIFDKVQWHIDGGEDIKTAIARIKVLFSFLDEQGLLTDEGKEVLNLGIDSSASIHERMLTKDGIDFMDTYYDEVMNENHEKIRDKLKAKYAIFCNDK